MPSMAAAEVRHLGPLFSASLHQPLMPTSPRTCFAARLSRGASSFFLLPNAPYTMQLTAPSAWDYLTTASKVKLEGLRLVPVSTKEPIVVFLFLTLSQHLSGKSHLRAVLLLCQHQGTVMQLLTGRFLFLKFHIGKLWAICAVLQISSLIRKFESPKPVPGLCPRELMTDSQHSQQLSTVNSSSTLQETRDAFSKAMANTNWHGAPCENVQDYCSHKNLSSHNLLLKPQEPFIGRYSFAPYCNSKQIWCLLCCILVPIRLGFPAVR